jgi:hypothetical protein
MAMACWLAYRDYNVRVVLAAEIADNLAHDNIEPLLQDEYLFIPDLQVWPAAFRDEEQLTKSLFRTLLKRRERCLPTVVHVDNPDDLGSGWELFFSWFYLQEGQSQYWG